MVYPGAILYQGKVKGHIYIFTNCNFEMFYCKNIISSGLEQCLTYFLDMDCQYNRKLVLACGLVSIHSNRRTFDRGLKTISTDIKQMVSAMGQLFVTEGMMTEFSIVVVGCTLIKAKGPVWHKSYMKKGEIPCLGIDTDARWVTAIQKMDIWIQTPSNMYSR